MRTNLAANGINVIFNYLLIGGHFGFPRLEVAGAGDCNGAGLLHRIFNERPVVGQSQKQAPADIKKKLAAQPGDPGRRSARFRSARLWNSCACGWASSYMP